MFGRSNGLLALTRKGVLMKIAIKAVGLLLVTGGLVMGAPTEVPAVSALSTPDNTKSVLTGTQDPLPPAVEATTSASCNGPSCIIYRNKKHMAPCAVESSASVCMKETGYDACCNKVTSSALVNVPICAPACPIKHDVRSSRNGGRVVHDYGRYEAVVTDKKDGSIEVRYRKRLLSR